jgi:hypothetical protein
MSTWKKEIVQEPCYLADGTKMNETTHTHCDTMIVHHGLYSLISETYDTYLMLLGNNPDFTASKDKFWHWYLFPLILFTSFFHVILMLNLLIAIMSNTFATVMGKVIAKRN